MLFEQHKRSALRIGYMALIASIAALLAADLFVSFSAEIAIRTLLIVGIAVPLATFVSLSSSGDLSGGAAAAVTRDVQKKRPTLTRRSV